MSYMSGMFSFSILAALFLPSLRTLMETLFEGYWIFIHTGNSVTCGMFMLSFKKGAHESISGSFAYTFNGDNDSSIDSMLNTGDMYAYLRG